MRIALVFAAILGIGVCAQAGAQDIGRICAAEAGAKALHGQDRIRFEAKCKTRKTNAPIVVGNHNGEPQSALCAGSPAEVFIGSCPLCVLLFALGDDSHCYVR